MLCRDLQKVLDRLTTIEVPNSPGIYVARVLSNQSVPVTQDSRYVNTCGKVDNSNVKIGKAKSLAARQRDYWKDFGKENVAFIPVALVDDIQKRKQRF